jgi:transcriptional regulator with XRE-family HTH domain
MKYGEYLKYLLDEKGMSQTELAEKSGIGKTTIGELIKGRSKEPTFSKAKRIADALGVPLQQFADNVDNII